MPGGLRHSIACALLNVDVPPFDSLNGFSRDLVQHEHGVRADVVRRVLARSAVDRTVSPFSFRHRLRNAPWLNAAPSRMRMMTAAAACLMAGLALIASGESLHGQTPIVARQTVPAAAKAATTSEPRMVPVEAALSARPTPSNPSRRHGARRVSMRRDMGPATPMSLRDQPPSRAASRGVLDRLHLGWLRTGFTGRHDR